MTLKQLIKREGGPAAFSRLIGAPYRTVQAWWREGAKDGRKAPQWLQEVVRDAVRWRKQEVKKK